MTFTIGVHSRSEYEDVEVQHRFNETVINQFERIPRIEQEIKNQSSFTFLLSTTFDGELCELMQNH